MSRETFAVVLIGEMPDQLFQDMEAAVRYVRELLSETKAETTTWWPVPVHEGGEQR